jgi:hypothetical protein
MRDRDCLLPSWCGVPLAALSVGLLTVGSARAIQFDNDSTDGTWENPANWVGDVLPGTLDIAELFGPQTINLSTTQSIFQLQLGDSLINATPGVTTLNILPGGDLTLAAGNNRIGREVTPGNLGEAEGRLVINGGNFTSLGTVRMSYDKLDSADSLIQIIAGSFQNLNNTVVHVGRETRNFNKAEFQVVGSQATTIFTDDMRFRRGLNGGRSVASFVIDAGGVTAITVEGLLGDFDGSGVLDLPDINLLMDAVRAGTNDPTFDLTGSGTVTLADRDEWVLNLFGSSAIGDVNLDGGVTALGDLSPALANLGQPGPKTWQQGNINDDLVVTALGDLSVILAGLGSEPAAPGSDAAADAALEAPAPNTAVAEYDPSTGVITIRANQVALVAITSDGENLVPGSLTGNFGGLAATDFPNLGEAAWVTSSNILGGVIPGADTVSVSVTPGTPLSDLTLLYQITGNQLTTGVITLIPEPAAAALLALGGLALRRRRVA